MDSVVHRSKTVVTATAENAERILSFLEFMETLAGVVDTSQEPHRDHSS